MIQDSRKQNTTKRNMKQFNLDLLKYKEIQKQYIEGIAEKLNIQKPEMDIEEMLRQKQHK